MKTLSRTVVFALLLFHLPQIHAIEYVPTKYPVVAPESFGLLETQNQLVVCFDTDKGPLCGELNLSAFNLCQMTAQNSMVCPDSSKSNPG